MWRGRTAELSRSASWPSVGGLFAFGKTPEVAKPIEPKPEPIREPEPAPQQNFVQQVRERGAVQLLFSFYQVEDVDVPCNLLSRNVEV